MVLNEEIIDEFLNSPRDKKTPVISKIKPADTKVIFFKGKPL
tara:strand:+ start:15784 stop:15909 length:126 start_codon:yes stop_codon:yes gene_type:complete